MQKKYDDQLKPLMAKIKELEAERNKEIDALLTPEQLKRVEDLRAESLKARAKPDAAKPAEGDAKKKAEAGQ